MLKVVGASWSQTRYSSLLIASVALMGMVTILFLEFVPRDVYDGRYAATVFWNAQTGFRIEFWGQGNDPRTIRKGVARAYYRPEMLSTGWAVLEIETQPSYPDHVQAHAAGLLEGSLSWQLIYWHWQNTVDSACEGRVKFCDEITDFLEDNRDFIREKARLYDHEDPFWHQVNMFYEQLDGLEVGWRYAVKRSRQEDDVDIPRTDFLWLNVMSDILDLEAKKNMSKELIANNRPPLSLALLKLIPGDMTDFILSHATGGYYSSMLRVQKQYKFGLHETGKLGSRPVPGQIITFTSYPGSVFSQDDFYKVTNGGSSQANSKLVISGTVLKNLNPDSWALVDATEQVLIGPRVLAANRLARNPEQWAEIISKNSSGTGNKQWLVIQPKVSQGQGQGQESSNATAAGGLTVWIAEQMPGLSRAGDISAHLKDSGYFISYGLPMFKDIQNVGGYHKHERKELTAARLLLQQGQENVTDLKTMLELMRSPDISLFGRGDLLTMDELTRQTDAFYNDSLHFFPAPNKTHPNHLNSNNNHNLKKTGQLDLGLYASNPKKSFRNVFKKIIALKKLRKELSTKDENESSASSDSAETVQSEEDKLQFRDRTQILPHSPKSINDAQKPDLTGVIDFKVLTHKDDVFHAASGPLYSKYGSQIIIEPFQWSKSQISDHPHNGHSDIWQFEPVQTEWVW